MRKFLLLFLTVSAFQYSYSQDFSNKGKEFWVGYGYHQVMLPAGGNAQEMLLYFATDQITTVTVSIPGTGYSVTYPNIPANTVFSTPTAAAGGIPKSGAQDARLLNVEGAFNKGIHIVADKPIIAYAHIYNSSVSGATILYPTATLGKEYYSVNFTNNSNTTNANCWFYVIATEPGTTAIEITPSANTIGGWTAGNTYTVNLTQGQIYNVLGTTTGNNGVDLTGSKVRSIAVGTQQCKRIAVFSGSGRIAISCNGTAPSSDNYMVQSLPKNAWGKKYLTVPSANYTSTTSVTPLTPNYYRVCVQDPTTVVTLDGSPIPYALLNNFYYQIPANPNLAPMHKIESDKPIMVAQYFPSQGSSGCITPSSPTDGDPEVIYLSPVEQSINSVNWNACSNFAINSLKHFINIVIPNSGSAISSFTLDGVPVPAASFTIHPQDPNYSYAILRVSGTTISPGVSHIAISDSGFNAIAYGYGPAESYGYNAGTNVKDLYQQISVQTQYGIETSPSVCTNSPFKFKISLPYQPLQLIWQLGNLPGGTNPNNNDVTQNPTPTCPTTTTYVCHDSTTTVNGKQIWWYSLPLYYSIPAIGTYPITILAQTNDADGCGNQQEIDFNLQVSDPPVAGFMFTIPGCRTDTVRFTDQTITIKPEYHWYWDFDDPGSGANNFSNIANPVHVFSTTGNHVVRFASITTPGCLSDTLQKTVFVPTQPTATIAGTTAVCQNGAPPAIQFTASGGLPPYTFTYNINGGASQTVTSSGTGTSATVSASPGTVGTFIYNLTNVQNAPAAFCSSAVTGQTATITVNPLPAATISGTITVCQNSPAPFVTFTGSNGTRPYTFSYTLNGVTQTPVMTTGSSDIKTIAAPTGVTGTFNYALTSIKDGSTTACTKAATGTATVTVKALPTATVTGNAEVCLNAASPHVVFTGAGGTAPYQVTYTLNSVSTTTATTGSVLDIPVPTTTAGTFVYNLISVQESGTQSCEQNQTGSVTVIIDPKPTASFTTSAPYCAAKDIMFTPAFSVSSGSVVSWIWNYGDGTGSHTRPDGNPFNVNYTTTGPKTVTFQTVSDKGCLSAVFTQVIIINPKPVAGFIVPEVCLLDPFAQFTDTSKVTAPATITGWQWNFGDAYATPANPNTSTAQNPTHIYTVVGPYTAQLIVTTNSGCKDTISHSLYISQGNPVADFTVINQNNLCSNDSVGIQNKTTIVSGQVSKLEIYWDYINQPTAFQLDDDPVFDKIYRHKYPTLTTPQNYTIHLRAYSGGVCYSSKNIIVTVHAAPVAQLAPIPDVCLNNGTLQFTQGSETGGVPGTGVYSGAGVSISGLFDPLAATPGIHPITYTFTSAFGCADSKTVNVKVLEAPMANFAPLLPNCQNTAITFYESSTVTAGTIVKWVWHWGDGAPDETFTTAGSRSHFYTITGSVTATLTVTSDYGCKSLPKSVTFIVNPQPHPNFSFTAVACLPQAKITFTNLTPPSLSDWTYQWNFDDVNASSTNPNTSSALNPSHIYTTIGPHNVRLIATSPTTSCTHDTTINISSSLHPAPVASFISSRASICENQTLTVTDHSNPADGTITSWIWDFGDNTAATSGHIQPPHTYTSAGDYIVHLNVTNNFGCTDDTSRPFKVYSYPVANAGPDLVVLAGGQVQIQSSASGSNLSFLWTPATYLNSATVLQPIVKPFDDITYNFIVTGTGGCKDTDMVFVKVLKAPEIPNTFTPNNDGTHDTWDIKYLTQYPGNIVQVFTRTGQLVFESHGYSKPWNGTKNGAPLPFDTYYYIIEPGSGRDPITGYVTIVK